MAIRSSLKSNQSPELAISVVALIDRLEATLKRLGPARDGSVELIPENDTMAPMRYATSRVDIQGIVVGQMRSY